MNVAFKQHSPRTIRYASAEVKAWAGGLFGVVFREPSFALGVLNGHGKLVGAVIYNNYEARNVEMTIFGPRGAFYRGVCREIFGYAFEELGVSRVTLTCRERYPEIIDKARRWGWKIEGRMRDYYGPDDHAIILGMLKGECRFLGPDVGP